MDKPPFDIERAAFLLLAALVAYVMTGGWIVMAYCWTHEGCKPGEYGIRAIIQDTLLPVLIMFLFKGAKDR